jgi:hypothetical protein
MSREILDAMKALAVEKGIAPDRLIHALEDALLSAYKKQPGAAKYARVTMDRESADFRVDELIVPGFIDHDPEEHYFTLLPDHGEVLRRMAAFDVVINATSARPWEPCEFASQAPSMVIADIRPNATG